uniref:Uncharacterized protein n=1 Tax=Anguilla anguilla TaxID=7936 RepID=A0A0E9V6P9_ANGAN
MTEDTNHRVLNWFKWSGRIAFLVARTTQSLAIFCQWFEDASLQIVPGLIITTLQGTPNLGLLLSLGSYLAPLTL